MAEVEKEEKAAAVKSPKTNKVKETKKAIVSDMVNIAEAEKPLDGMENGLAVDGCMAVEMWYWNSKNEFRSEVMFCNPIESETPKLIVPLDVFEKMKRIYNEKSRILAFKKSQFDELLQLFREMRRHYWQELQSLREIIKASKDAIELRNAGGYVDPKKKAKIDRLDTVVATTDVHFFNVLDCIDPEFKDILINECRQFHRELIIENASLRDQLAALGGGDMSLEEKLQYFIENFELIELIQILCKYRPPDNAPEQVRIPFYKAMLQGCGGGMENEQNVDIVITNYILGDGGELDIQQTPEYKELQQKYEDATEKIGDLRDSMEREKSRFEMEIETKEQETDELRSQKYALEDEVGVLRAKIEGDTTAQELAETKEEVVSLSAQIEEFQERVTKLTTERDEAVEKAGEASAEQVTELTEKIGKLEEALMEAQRVAEEAVEQANVAGAASGVDASRKTSSGSGEGGADPEWEAVKAAHPDATKEWIDALVMAKGGFELQEQILREEIAHLQENLESVQEGSDAMINEIIQLQDQMQSTTDKLGIQHPDKLGAAGNATQAQLELMGKEPFKKGDIVDIPKGFQCQDGSTVEGNAKGIIQSISENDNTVTVKYKSKRKGAQEMKQVTAVNIRISGEYDLEDLEGVLSESDIDNIRIGDAVRLRRSHGGIPAGTIGIVRKVGTSCDVKFEVPTGSGSLKQTSVPIAFLKVCDPRTKLSPALLSVQDEPISDAGAMGGMDGDGGDGFGGADGGHRGALDGGEALGVSRTGVSGGNKRASRNRVSTTQRKPVASQIAAVDAQTGRSIESLRQELEERRKEKKTLVSLGEVMRTEMEQLRQVKLDLEKKFDSLHSAHADLLRRQEQAYDNDLTGNCENDVYVFCLWLLRRFGTIREGFVTLDVSGGGTLDLQEIINGLEKYQFMSFFARRIMRQLDTDGSGDLDLQEVIQGKEIWALQENTRGQVSKVEVDTMKEGFAAKEASLKRLYDDAKKELEKMKEALKKAQEKARGGEGRMDPAMMKMNAKMGEEMAKMNKKVAALEAELAALQDRYDRMEEKCSKSVWQLRQDHAEVVRLTREKIDKDIEIKKLHVRIDTLKRVKEAKNFIDKIHLDDEETAQELETKGLQKIADLLHTEEQQLREVSSAALLLKLEGKDVPYRIRNEIAEGKVKRWQYLYADAKHRKKVDDRGLYRSGSPSPPYREKVTTIDPMIGELRETMAQVPHGSWSYDFRFFGQPAAKIQSNHETAFQSGKIVSMVTFDSQRSIASPAPQTERKGLYSKSSIRQMGQTWSNFKASNSTRGGMQRSGTSHSPLARIQPIWTTMADTQMKTIPIHSAIEENPMSGAMDEVENPPVTVTTGASRPSVSPITPRPRGGTLPWDMPQQQAPSPKQRSNGPLSPKATRAVMKNLSQDSPRRRREGSLQITSDDPDDLQARYEGLRRSRTPSASPSMSRGGSAKTRKPPPNSSHVIATNTHIPKSARGPTKVNIEAASVMDIRMQKSCSPEPPRSMQQSRGDVVPGAKAVSRVEIGKAQKQPPNAEFVLQTANMTIEGSPQGFTFTDLQTQAQGKPNPGSRSRDQIPQTALHYHNINFEQQGPGPHMMSGGLQGSVTHPTTSGTSGKRHHSRDDSPAGHLLGGIELHNLALKQVSMGEIDQAVSLSPNANRRGLQGAMMSPSKFHQGTPGVHGALAGGYFNQGKHKAVNQIAFQPPSEVFLGGGTLNVSVDDLRNHANQHFGNTPQAHAKAPAHYRVPGGRYIPKKTEHSKLDSLERIGTGTAPPSMVAYPSVGGGSNLGGPSTRSMDDSAFAANQQRAMEQRQLPFDPRDPQGKGALPNSHYDADSVHPLRRNQDLHGDRSRKKEPKKVMMSIPISPFKSVDQWVNTDEAQVQETLNSLT